MKIFLIFLLLFLTSTQLFAKSNNPPQLSELVLTSLKTDKTTATTLIKNKRPTLLFFWASWCTYCKDIIPVLKESVYEKFDVYPISFDDDKQLAKKAWNGSYSNLKEGYWLDKKASSPLSIPIFPKVYLILPNGKIDTVYEGSQGDKLHYMANRIRYITNQMEAEIN